MRKANRRKCLDVAVVRGADCNTDRSQDGEDEDECWEEKVLQKRAGRCGCVKRWNVSKLQGS